MSIMFQDIGTILINAKPAFALIKDTLIPAISLLTGTIFIFQGFLRLSKVGDERGDMTISKVLSSFIIGAFAVQYGQTVSLATDIMALNGGLSYSPNTGNSYTDQVVSAVLFIVSVFGAYSIFSALLDAKKAGEGDRQDGDLVMKALWKFLGGAVALNLGSFLQ